MNYSKESEIKLDDKDLYIIDVLSLDEKSYIYTQRIENNDLTDEYFIYDVTDTPKLVEDKETLTIILDRFIKSLNEEMGD